MITFALVGDDISNAPVREIRQGFDTASPEAATKGAPNFKHRNYRNDARFTLQSGESSKTCAKCLQVKLASEFFKHSSNKDGLQKECKVCIQQTWADYRQSWKQRNRPKINAYMRDYLKLWRDRHPDEVAAIKAKAKAKAASRIESRRIPRPECSTHGNHSDWKHNKTQTCWWCQKCKKLTRKKATLAKESRKRFEFFSSNYGDKFSEVYKHLASTDEYFVNLRGPSRIFSVKKHIWLLEHSLKVTLELSKRIGRMQKIVGRGFHNTELGWNCAACGVFALDPRFFDIEHIVPRAKGGSDKVSNLQILCPSCHRVKTLSEFHGISIISPRSGVNEPARTPSDNRVPCNAPG